MKRKLKEMIMFHDMGLKTDQQFVEDIKAMFSGTTDRVDYVRQHYTYDPMTGVIFNTAKGTPMSNQSVHAGVDVAPIPFLRAKWFLIVGDDPWQVRSDKTGGMYALYETGGDRVYARDILPEDKHYLLAEPSVSFAR